MSTDADLAQGIGELLAVVEDVNICHGCLYNCENSVECIDTLDKVADLIDFPNELRWWNRD